jgi:hypothetical protein
MRCNVCRLNVLSINYGCVSIISFDADSDSSNVKSTTYRLFTGYHD